MEQAAKGVVDWDEAMEQCGDDEEFLRELLNDLRGEADEQIEKIEETIKNPKTSSSITPFHSIMRAAHVIKGAAANLMCSQLRDTSKALEKAASAGHELGDPKGSEAESAWSDVKQKFSDLKEAMDEYKKFLSSIGV